MITIDWAKTVTKLKQSARLNNEQLALDVSKWSGKPITQDAVAKLERGVNSEPLYSTGQAIVSLCNKHNVAVATKS